MIWKLQKEDLKRYPHFDKHLSIEEIEKIVKSSDRVRTNAFFPFIKYDKIYQPFRRKKGSSGKIEKPDKKTRTIRYACRRDAHIFSYYRHLISDKYEVELKKLDIQDCPIAYRKIPISASSLSGKCNIDFAKDAFSVIHSIKECSALVLDISGYFESLDHAHIHAIWCRLFGFDDLPADHAAVYKNITQYKVVDRTELYERLGFFGEKEKNGIKIKGYLVPFKKIPTQLCSVKDFRDKVAGKDKKYPKLIETNKKIYGIPQGAPISDIIANFYLIDFDVLLNEYVKKRGGFYTRYSDDIIIILPGSPDNGLIAMDFIRSKIKEFGDQLEIKESKCSLVSFSVHNEKLRYKHVHGKKGHNGLEYLGFRFTGSKVYLKDSTLSNLYRKISGTIRHDVKLFVKRNPSKDREYLYKVFDIENIFNKFGKAKDFDKSKTCEDWTFWTYAKRAAETFGPIGSSIIYQLKRQRAIVKKKIIEEFQSE